MTEAEKLVEWFKGFVVGWATGLAGALVGVWARYS